MNKSLHIIALAALSLGILSCSRLTETDLPDGRPAFPENATLSMGFCIPADIPTKATDMAEEPRIETLHVLIFDEEGTLLQVREATMGTVSANYDGTDTQAVPDNTMVSFWKIDNVTMTNEKRILHFVANVPANKLPKYGSESSIFQTLSVDEPIGAYWQRVELNSILPYTYRGNGLYTYVDPATGELKTDQPVKVYNNGTPPASGSYIDLNGYTVNQNDYIDHNSCKIVNGTGYYYVPDSESPLRKMIPLVRNFVKITFTNAWTGFDLKKVALVNTPKSGLVAPFSGIVNHQAQFVSAYTGLIDDPAGTTPLIANVNGYKPILSSDGIRTGGSGTNGAWQDSDFSVPASGTQTVTLFMYERDIPENYPTCVLIGGELTGATSGQQDSDGNTWFKIEIATVDGDYFPFYRNFTYDMTLGSIENPSTAGRPSPQQANEDVAVGDLSNSPETETLEQITDGNGLYLWVSYIDYESMSATEGTVDLIYTFFHDDNGSKTYFCEGGTDRITFDAQRHPGSNLEWAMKEYDFTGSSTVEWVHKAGEITSSDGALWAKVPNPDYRWFRAQVRLKGQAGDILQNDLHVIGTINTTDSPHYHKKLSRVVTYTVTHKQRLGLEATEIAANAAGYRTALTITLPNTLGPAVFPLTLKIEAEDNNLTPDPADASETVSVEAGPSAFDPRNTFYFVKIIDYSVYRNSPTKEFTYHFKTTKATAGYAGGVATRIRVTEKTDGESWFLDGADATCNLLYGNYIATTGVSLNNSSITLLDNNSETLIATVTPSNASNQNIHWSSSDDSVATVNEGTVTGVGSGTATITVTTDDGAYTATCTVTVKTKHTDTSTFSPSDFDGNDSSTKNDITLLLEGNISYNDSYYSNNTQLYLLKEEDNGYYSYISFTQATSSSKELLNITLVVFDCFSSIYIPITTYTSAYLDSEHEVSTGSYSTSGSQGTWEGSAAPLYFIMGGRDDEGNTAYGMAITSITVEYEYYE